jgi:hypothetical protein
VKDINLCRDCQKEQPAYVAGRMYKRCMDCLEAYDRRLNVNREAKLRRQSEAIRNARSQAV